ncbi:MAG: chromate efflux transporter [Betaproteobacteria bacterium]|nr:chromate efflux transporter [Betaproteobacteria bacterium]
MSMIPADITHHWKDLVKVFLKLGAMSYGGPAIMGIMQSEIQEKRGWLSKQKFLEGLALVNMLPGAGATQLGIFIGYHRAGWRGGVLAGLCFILPAFFIMLALTLLYSTYGALPVMRDAFYGLGPVVLGIFVVALCRLGRTALKGTRQILLAGAAALAVAFTPLGIVTTLLLAGSVGVMLYHSRALGLRAALVMLALFAVFHWGYLPQAGNVPIGHGAATGQTGVPGLWGIGSFFFTVGAFTFGGGITMLAFVQEQVVNQLHWLTPQEFLDGLALGQLTPGPILMLAAYVGYKLTGIGGALAGAGAIFLPSFVLMLSVLPVLARFRELLWIKAAMKGITAAVIGAISVSLLQMAPHAAPDAFTSFLAMLTVAAMLWWRIGPLPLMLGGSYIGATSRLNPLERLKELA